MSALRPALRSATLKLGGERVYERLRARSVARDIRSGHWTEPEISLIPHAVAAGDTVLDVGANFGLYSFHLSAAVGASGAVYAFEPVPATCLTLRRVVAQSGLTNVRVVEAGASDSAGEARIVLPRRDDGSTDSGRAWAVRGAADEPDNVVNVRMVRLDDELAGAEPSFIKCDVEGAELFALRGARRLLEESAPTVLFEASAQAMQRYDLTPGDLSELLTDVGYTTYAYVPGEDALRPVRDGDFSGNLVAVHPRRAERLAALLPAG